MNTSKLRSLLIELTFNRGVTLEEDKYSAPWVKEIPTKMMGLVIQTIQQLGGDTSRFGVQTKDDSQMTTGKVHIHRATLDYNTSRRDAKGNYISPNKELMAAFTKFLATEGFHRDGKPKRDSIRGTIYQFRNEKRKGSIEIALYWDPKRLVGDAMIETYHFGHHDEVTESELSEAGTQGSVTPMARLAEVERSVRLAMEPLNEIQQILNWGGSNTDDNDRQAAIKALKDAASSATKALGYFKRKR